MHSPVVQGVKVSVRGKTTVIIKNPLQHYIKNPLQHQFDGAGTIEDALRSVRGRRSRGGCHIEHIVSDDSFHSGNPCIYHWFGV
jgi:hypothetical protein